MSRCRVYLSAPQVRVGARRGLGRVGQVQDGRFALLIAGGTATAVVGVTALEDGKRDAVLGVLSDPGAGEFEVAVSGDDRYAFVTDETQAG
ncbi:MAG: hypothetical protein ACRDMI_18020 [Streptosporangiaceae bacterium]